jgi:hypothetical protein
MRKIFTSIIILALFSTFTAKAQTTAMDFTRDDCFGGHHNLFSELDSGKVIVLDFIMLGCTSCLVASDAVSNLIEPLEISNPGRVKLYAFGYIKNYNCEQLLSWNSSNNIGATMFNDGSEQIGYYGGMGMPTLVVCATNNHTVLYKKLGYTPSDDEVIMAAIQQGLAYNPQGVAENLTANGFKVYPTFFKGEVNVKSTKPYNGTFVIYDVTGKEVIREEIRGTGEVTVNTQSLPKGLYFATIMDQSGMMGSVKLIKQ